MLFCQFQHTGSKRVCFCVSGALQLASAAERLHQRVDPDVARHQGRALQRSARVRPALQVGPGQEGPRRAQENLSSHTATQPKQQRFDCKFRATVPFVSFLSLSLTALVVQDSGRRPPAAASAGAGAP